MAMTPGDGEQFVYFNGEIVGKLTSTIVSKHAGFYTAPPEMIAKTIQWSEPKTIVYDYPLHIANIMFMRYCASRSIEIDAFESSGDRTSFTFRERIL